MPPKTDQIVALSRELREKFERVNAIRDAAESENRELSRRERAEIDVIKKDTEKIQQKADALRGGGFDPRLTQGDPRIGAVDAGGMVLTREQRVADWVNENRGNRGNGPAYLSDVNPDDISLGKVIRGMVTSDWRGAEDEHRALVEGTDSLGGYLTPEPLAAQFIDRVRNASRVMQAGAQTVPMTSDVLNIARLTGGAGVAWKSEGAAIGGTDPQFDRVTFTARTLPLLIKISRELFDDMSSEAASGIEHEIAMALSLELDRACLRGNGTPPEVRGIKNQSGVTLQSLGANGNTPVWDNVIDGVANVRALNLEPSAILWSSRTATQLSKIKLTTGEYVPKAPAIASIPQLVTNQIPNNLTVGSSNDCSEVYIGDFTQLLVGLRTDLRFSVQVLTERFADNLQVGLLTYLRADVQLQHPEGFNVMTGVRP